MVYRDARFGADVAVLERWGHRWPGSYRWKLIERHR
jgi:hypothetical protein